MLVEICLTFHHHKSSAFPRKYQIDILFVLFLFSSANRIDKIFTFYFMIFICDRLTTKIPRFNELWTFMRQNMRPWSEFFNFSNFKTVANFQRLSSRFLRNCNYFLINYVMISFVLILYCL